MQDQALYIAETIKKFRKSRGLSLDAMAALSDVSRSMIYQIENGATSPTIAVLSKLAKGMGMGVGELVEPSSKPSLYRLSNIESARTTVSGDKSFVCRLLSEGSPNRHLEIFAFHFVKKGKHTSKGHGGSAVEYLYVTSGKLSVEVGDEVFEVQSGEMLEFRADKQHTYRCENPGARGLCAVYFPV